MLRIIGAMGIDSYFQPLKNLLRWQMQGEAKPWSLPSGQNKTIYLKETLGPYSSAESTFNPLSLLLDAGVPKDRLHIWLYGRYPLDCYASWEKWWHGSTSLDYFIESYQTTAKIYQQAQDAGIPTTCLTYEAFNQHPPDLVTQKIAERFRLAYTPTAIRDWDSLPEFGSPGSNIFLPEEPDAFIMPGIHDAVHYAKEFTYSASVPSQFGLVSRKEEQDMTAAGLFTLYDQWQTACKKDLNLVNQLA